MAPGTGPPQRGELARTTAETDAAELRAAGIETAGAGTVEAQAAAATAIPPEAPADWSVAPRILLHRTPIDGGPFDPAYLGKDLAEALRTLLADYARRLHDSSGSEPQRNRIPR